MGNVRTNGFLGQLRKRATEGGLRKILLPEAGDERTREAAKVLEDKKLASPVFCKIDEARAGELEKLLLEIRASKKGTADELTRDMAAKLARDPLFYAMYLLRLGEAEGLVAGASRESRDVIRAALWLIGKAEGIQTVSSSFYMIVPDFRGEGEEVLTFADCAVVPEPTAEQLADIAIASADARRRIVGDEPRVALLSYSTKGSGGESEAIARIRKTLEIVRKQRPDIVIDGEMQGDAALIKAISEKKAPGSSVGGNANVLVFPSLDAANIAYKLVAHLVPGASALGPVLQGTKKPISDLSRGATVEDIVETALVVASQV